MTHVVGIQPHDQMNFVNEGGMNFNDDVLVRLILTFGRSPTRGGSSWRLEQSDKSKIWSVTHADSSSGSLVMAVDRKSSIDKWSNPPMLGGISVIDLAFCKTSSSSDVIQPISAGSDCNDWHLRQFSSIRFWHRTIDGGKIRNDLHSRRNKRKRF